MAVVEPGSVIGQENGGSVRESVLERYVPLAVWTIVILSLILTVLKIISYGLVPAGDARRHIAKAFTDKPYTDLLVLRPEYSMDHSPGWEWLLKALHQAFGWDADALAAFSIASTLLVLLLAPLPWLRRPEAWMGAVLAEMVALPTAMNRFSQGRPFLLTAAVLIAILVSWAGSNEKTPSRLKLGLTSVGIGLSVWMHGAWYLWAIPIAAFFLAGWWRTGLRLAGCVAAGTLAGSLLTGRPFEFLKQALLIAAVISSEKNVPQHLLVGEFRSHAGDFATLVLLALVFLWHSRLKATDTATLTGPIFWQIIICWILGFRADRFWADWGIPAVFVWLALRGQDIISRTWTPTALRHLLACTLLGVAFFLNLGADRNARYTHSHDDPFPDASRPDLAGWFPDRGGILYTSHMYLFYNTFYQNPNGEWRYIIGMEPALMPEGDLKIFRQIQRSNHAPHSYEPWIRKMRPADRLLLQSNGKPSLPQLEWKHIQDNLWIGRTPRDAPGTSTPDAQ